MSAAAFSECDGAANARRIPIIRFRSVKDNVGTADEVTWPEVCAFLSTPIARRPGETHEALQARLPGYSFVTCDGTRGAANVRSIHLLSIDIDSGAVSLQRIEHAYAGRAAVVHSTRRATPSAPRWRVVVQISRPLTPDEHAVLVADERERLAMLNIAIDTGASEDVSRLWFPPVEPAEGAFVAKVVEGAALDVDDTLARLARQRAGAADANDEAAPPHAANDANANDGGPTPSARPSEPDWLRQITMTTRARRARSYVETCAPAVAGDGGHATAMRVATAIVRGFALDRSSAIEVLASWNSRCAPPWSARELTHKIEEAERVGEMIWGAKLTPSNQASSGDCPGRRPRSLTDIVESWRAEGPLEVVPSGIDPLDAATRGGFVRGRMVVVLGAPDAGKTAFVVCQAMRMADAHGYVVGVLSVDEDDDDMAVRVFQMEGHDRFECERRQPAALDVMARDAAALQIVFYDATWTIEDAATDLAQRSKHLNAPGAVFVVDSLQTARARAALAAETPRAVVTANVAALKLATQGHRFVTLVTSEMNRGAYRSEQSAAESNDMAAGKESGAIEYGAKLMISLRSVAEHNDLIRARIVKNKRGPSWPRCPDFQLRFSHTAHRMSLDDGPVSEAPPKELVRDQKKQRETQADARALIKFALKASGLSQRKLRDLACGELGWGKDRFAQALAVAGAGVDGSALVDVNDVTPRTKRAESWVVLCGASKTARGASDVPAESRTEVDHAS